MLVTFDSNDSRLVPEVVDRCNAEAFQWCRSECECRDALATSSPSEEAKLLYDTPIALCDARDAFPNITHHFVYIDFTQRNASYERIAQNISKLKSPFALIGNDPDDVGLEYAVGVKNAPITLIAEALASVINGYIRTGALQHPDDLATKNYGTTALTNAMKLKVAIRDEDINYQRDCTNHAC